MASYQTGKICILLLFFSMSFIRNVPLFFVSGSSSSLNENSQHSTDCEFDTDNDVSAPSHHHQQSQIDRLEQLVKNLTELVAKLESHYSAIPRIEKLAEASNYAAESEFGYRESESEGFSGDDNREEGKSRTPAPVTKYSAYWSEQFRFVSAVDLDSIATSMTVLPFRDFEGHSKYIAVGDDHGRVYVLLRNGDVVIEFYTLSESPVTAMLSFMSVYKNESFVLTGHSSGAILVHRVWESSSIDDGGKLLMENVVALNSVPVGEKRSAISLLEVHNVGKFKYFLSADVSGRIKVFKENGELHGLAVPTSRPLAFLKQRLLFLTETGAGSLDLRNMKVREVPCEGLNQSKANSYVFDPTERSKAYGFTSSGDLINVLLLGDALNIKCRARPWKNIDIDHPLAFQVIKGYLLIADNENLHVYNISSQHYARFNAPRLVFSSRIEEITSSFLSKEHKNTKRVPLIVTDRDRLIVLGFGGGFVGMYKSKLPVIRPESNSMLWTTPVLFFIVFLFVAWKFFANKKEALISWGSDDPYSVTSVSSGAPSASSGSVDGSFSDASSRVSDGMDLRSSVSGYSSTRTYGSPVQYPIRGASELTFRGSNLDSGGYHVRRENVYVSSQVLDESG